VSDIYKVSEVAEMLGFSAKTIRRDIASMSDDVRKMSLACPSDVPVMSLTEYGLKWLAEKHGVPLSSSQHDGLDGQQEEKQESENELVSSLLEQLRQKDIQIAEKDKQIAQLMEQAKNFQVLLQAQQVLSLPAPKKSFFKRLFGLSEEKE
jgi:hypothetical protein